MAANAADVRAAQRRYRVPEVHPNVDPVALSDFGMDEILEYIKHKGASEAEAMTSDAGVWVTSDDMDRAETLILCGQREEARLHILAIVGDAMGRKL